MITDEQLQELRRAAERATPGVWYARATDDRVCMNARYVSTESGMFRHDGVRGMDAQSDNQANSNHVIAVTLLQSPRLVDPDHFDENTQYIAAANPATMLALLDEVKLLRRIARAAHTVTMHAREQGDVCTCPTADIRALSEALYAPVERTEQEG